MLRSLLLLLQPVSVAACIGCTAAIVIQPRCTGGGQKSKKVNTEVLLLVGSRLLRGGRLLLCMIQAG